MVKKTVLLMTLVLISSAAHAKATWQDDLLYCAKATQYMYYIGNKRFIGVPESDVLKEVKGDYPIVPHIRKYVRKLWKLPKEDSLYMQKQAMDYAMNDTIDWCMDQAGHNVLQK